MQLNCARRNSFPEPLDALALFPVSLRRRIIASLEMRPIMRRAMKRLMPIRRDAGHCRRNREHDAQRRSMSGRGLNCRVPPCFSRIRIAMDSPRPVPADLVMKKGSNRRPCTSLAPDECEHAFGETVDSRREAKVQHRPSAKLRKAIAEAIQRSSARASASAAATVSARSNSSRTQPVCPPVNWKGCALTSVFTSVKAHREPRARKTCHGSRAPSPWLLGAALLLGL